MASEVERAIVAAVRANPDDWTAWLVFADWLTERGDARGQLIAWEHQLAVSADEQHALRQRVRALEEAQQGEWLVGWVPPPQTELEWRHGFLIGVKLRCPTGTLAVLDALVAHPTASLLSELGLDGGDLGDDGACALAASGSLRCLTALGLAGNGIGDDGVQALAKGDLRSLTELDLRDNRIGADGARALAAAESLGSLTALRHARLPARAPPLGQRHRRRRGPRAGGVGGAARLRAAPVARPESRR